MEFRILGPLEVRDGEAPLPLAGGRQRALLALLLLNAGRVVAVERLVDDLWGEEVPETAPKAVQIFVSKLRKVLPEGRLKTRPPGYLIELSQGELDLERFERLLADGRGALAQGRPEEAASLLREALSLWRGPALAEFAEPFAQPEGARLEELRLACLEERIEADLALGAHGELVGELEALVARHPLRERLRAQHMLALYRSGRHAEALSAYQEFRRRLDEELGIEPSQRLRDLERRILQQDPELDAPAEPAQARPAREPAPRAAPAFRVEEVVSRPERLVVGRDGELDRLRRLLEEALAGHRQVVFVSGRPGIGKTTLVRAFLDEAKAAGGLLVGRGQCFEQYGQGEAYMPVLEALGRLCRGSEGKELVPVLAARAPTWISQLPGLAESADTGSFEVGATRERMLRELVEALEAITEARPLMLLLEDLHWSDPSTVDVLSALARRDDPARLLLLATYRREDARAGAHPVWEAARELEHRGLASELRLQALTPRAVVDYLELRFPGHEFPLELAELLHERTDGNPLFLEKVVDSWVEGGSIAPVDGVFGLQATVAELSVDVPATVRQLIEHQLDELDREDQELVEAASAAGAEFAAAAVAVACRRPESDVETRLTKLARQGRFVEACGEALWPDGTVSARLAFVHDLYAEVAYARLPPGRRARLHRAIGARLESAFGGRAGEVAGELASHFVCGREAERAVFYLRLAAEQALARAGHGEAIEHLSAALAMLNELPATGERDERELAVRVELGAALMEARGYTAPEVKENYTRARELCARLGDTPHLRPVLYGLSTIAEVGGSYREALDLARELQRLASGGPEDAAAADARASLGWPLLCLGEFEAVLEALKPLLEGPGGQGDRDSGAVHGRSLPGIAARTISSWAHWFLGCADQADSMSESAMRLARELEHPFSTVYAITCDAFLRQLRRERDAACEQAATARRLAAEYGLPLWEAWASIVQGWAGDQGDVTIAGIRAGLDAVTASGSTWARTYLLALLGEAYAESGQCESGLRTLEEGLALAAANEERFYEPELRRLQADLELRLGREQAAESSLLEALELARGRQAKSLELRAAVSLARFWRDRGRAAQARELLSGVYTWFSEGFDTPDLRDAAELLAELGDAPPAGPAAKAAAARRAAPRIVGRGDELEHLCKLLDEALAGERRVVLISGEAGIGKTTLVESFVARAARTGGFLLGRGQCLEQHGAAEPYMPWLEALGRLCREPDDPGLVALLTRRAPTWLAHMPWLLRPEELETLQSRTLGATRERMLREMLETLEELTRQQPLVLVLEDLHWSDPSSIDLIEAVARRPDSARLLVLGTFRPENGASGHPLYGVASDLRLRGFAAELSLDALPAEAVREFLALRCPGSDLPDELAEALHERTRGNPLFVEKVVDSWLEQGSLREENGGWVVAGAIDALAVEVPSTVRELIEQRLAGVAEGDRQLLEAASVAGAEFSPALVAAACGRDTDEVEARLVELSRRSVLVEARGEEEWPDRTVGSRYAFTHDLYQEVLYDLLPAGRRARLHDRIGTRLERAYGDRAGEIAPALAFHFVRARDAGRAVQHLHRAAEQALARSAPREAIEQLSAGLGLLQSLREGAERDRWELALQGTLGPAQIAAKGWAAAEAEAALLRAQELAAELGQAGDGSRVLFNLATLYEVRGEYERSEALLEESLRLAGRPPAAPAVVDSNELLACSLFHQGAFRRALEHAEAGLSHFDGLYSNALTAAYGDDAGIACHSWAALALWFLGRPDQALRRAHQAVTMAADPRHAHALATAQAQAAVVSQCRLEPDATLEWADAAVASAEARGFRYRAVMGRILRGWALAAQGRTDAGIDELRGGLELSRTTGARMDDPYYLGLLADACAPAGRHEEALAALDEALELVLGSRTFFYEAELHRLRGDVLLGVGRRDDGEASLERALEVAQRQGSPALELRAAVTLGRLRREQGREAEAARLVASAYAKLTEGFDTPDLVQGRALLEELEAAPPVLGERPEPLPPRSPPRPGPTRPPVRYARSGDLNIAYQVTGEGPVDVVLVPGFVSHLEKDWEEPRHARFLDRLGSFSRLIRFDKRGTGLSDPLGGLPDLEARMDDVRAVMDAAGSERAVLLGYSEGGPMSILLAATYPERASSLVLYGSFAARLRSDDYPWAPTEAERQAYAEEIERDWGFEAMMRKMCPSADEAMARWWGERCRAAASPGAARALVEMNTRIDVRDVLPAIHVPTLVLHRRGDVDVRVEEGRYLAERIPGARFVELPGADHFVAVDPDQIVDEVEEFVTGARPLLETDRVLKTILVSDLVDSTETAARLGDRAWAELLEAHHRTVRDVLARFAGEEVDMAGDGVLALFDGPARAIRAGLDLRGRLAQLGLPVRVGIHTGEVHRVGGTARGIAVHVAARVAGEAAPAEVLVTATTRDLVAGSDLAFQDRGERRLKGFEEPRRLFEAVA